MVFFSKNRKTALEYVEKNNMGSNVALAKNQIPHRSGWRTWKVK